MTQRNMVGTDEREVLLGFLDAQRAGLRRAVHGLTDEEARLAPSASSLSVAGLIKHAASVEREWTGMIRQEPSETDFAKHAASFQPGEASVADLLKDYELAAEETDAAILAAADLDQPVPIPRGVPWFPKDIEAWNVRWVLVHLIEETARHAGHADIVRESIDGAQAVELRAAVEGWPENGFVKPWRR
ncbi:MAG TPA: DinB family protein [Actinospica sp.]|nr:DinB family protein [Actinospica sp.]